MGWKRSTFEALIWCAARLRRKRAFENPPRSILVLRNNDIGDLIVITPLFEALKRTFPTAKIVAGIGEWNRPVLERNPHVDEIVSVNAPWHNKMVSPQGLLPALRYLCCSPEVSDLKRQQFSVGIDILGSQYGSLLFSRAGVAYRVGRRGFAGGHSGVDAFIDYDSSLHVGQEALKYAELLGAKDLPSARPQLFLSDDERRWGEQQWQPRARGLKRVILAPRAGIDPRSWPLEGYFELAGKLAAHQQYEIVIVGGKREEPLREKFEATAPGMRNLTAQTGLRKDFALTAAADLIIANSSMITHVAAAFKKPAIVLLGPYYESAIELAKLWGHPESIMLGKDADRPRLYSVDEVYDRVVRVLESGK